MAQNNGKFVCYYRVSTGRQGKSGLGLDAQRAAVTSYLNGGDWQIVDEYTEVECGKRSDRPALEKALAAARLHWVLIGVGSRRRSANQAIDLPSDGGGGSILDAYTGAVAFSRTGDPATGEFGDAKLVRKFGDVPDDLSAL